MISHNLQYYITQFLEATGLADSQLKILLCTLLSFPFSVIFKRLPDHNYALKNAFNISVSAFYIFGILELYSGLQTLLISSLGCYFITRYVRTSSMPWINFLFLMTHLAYSHLHEQFFQVYDPAKIDITGAQMVLVMKLSAFGWNVYDAKQPKETLTSFTKERLVKKHPNLLSYFGYVFFYASLLTGPAFDFADYDKFIHATLFDDVPDSKRPGRRHKRRIPRSGIPAFKKTLQGVFWAVILLVLGKYVSLDYVLSGNFVKEHGFIYRIFYLWVLGFNHRLPYYTIWLIAEGACIQCGIGYNGYDSETDSFKWNRVQNIDPYKFETGQNCHVCLESWNMNTNKWLKHYVHKRIAKKGKKPGFKSTLFTFLTSAFWHGTRPGYYLTFIMGAFLQTLGKIYRRNFRPIFLQSDGTTPKSGKKIYDLVCYICTQLAFGFVVQPFMILDFKQSLYCWLTVHFYVQIATFITIFAFKGPYSKSLIAWCRSHHDSTKKDDIIIRPELKLSQEETAKAKDVVHTILEKRDDRLRSPALGLPPIDILESIDQEDIDEDLKELSNVWTSFRGRLSNLKDDDFDGLKDAYNNFTNEINDIFHVKKEDLLSKKQT